MSVGREWTGREGEDWVSFLTPSSSPFPSAQDSFLSLFSYFPVFSYQNSWLFFGNNSWGGLNRRMPARIESEEHWLQGTEGNGVIWV